MTAIWKAEHWLYKFIPRTWAAAGWWPFEWLLWLLFGNDEDGIFGEWTSHWWDDHGAKPSFLLFLKWQARNPLHNLMKHVLVWPSKERYLTMEWCRIFGWVFAWGTVAYLWPYGDEKQFSFSLFPLSFSWRSSNTEGYGFFAKQDGSFGFAIRKRNSIGA